MVSDKKDQPFKVDHVLPDKEDQPFKVDHALSDKKDQPFKVEHMMPDQPDSLVKTDHALKVDQLPPVSPVNEDPLTKAPQVEMVQPPQIQIQRLG